MKIILLMIFVAINLYAYNENYTTIKGLNKLNEYISDNEYKLKLTDQQKHSINTSYSNIRHDKETYKRRLDNLYKDVFEKLEKEFQKTGVIDHRQNNMNKYKYKIFDRQARDIYDAKVSYTTEYIKNFIYVYRVVLDKHQRQILKEKYGKNLIPQFGGLEALNLNKEMNDIFINYIRYSKLLMKKEYKKLTSHLNRIKKNHSKRVLTLIRAIQSDYMGKWNEDTISYYMKLYDLTYYDRYIALETIMEILNQHNENIYGGKTSKKLKEYIERVITPNKKLYYKRSYNRSEDLKIYPYIKGQKTIKWEDNFKYNQTIKKLLFNKINKRSR